MERPKIVGFDYSAAACEGFCMIFFLICTTRDLEMIEQNFDSPWKIFCRFVTPCRCLESPSNAAPCHSSHHRHRQSAKNWFVQLKLWNLRWFLSCGGWSGWVTFNRLNYVNLRLRVTIWRCLRKTILRRLMELTKNWINQQCCRLSSKDFHFTILNYALRMIIRSEIDEWRKEESFPDGVKNAKLRWSCAAWWIH